MTVTVLSEVLALMTGRVPCFFSRSFSGRSRTTTWTEAVAAGERGCLDDLREDDVLPLVEDEDGKEV